MSFKKFILYCFDDMIKFEDFDFDILIDEKSHENILIYEISYKTLVGAKPLRIRFDKIDVFIRIFDQNRYLTLFSSSFICILKLWWLYNHYSAVYDAIFACNIHFFLIFQN